MRGLFLAVLAAVFLAIGHAQASGADSATWYIVRLSDAPVATYKGGILGLDATDAHMIGHSYLDTTAPATRAYVGYLEKRQAETLESARQIIGHDLAPRFQYRYALNGMSVQLTAAEAAAMARLPGVVSVQPVRHFRPSVGISAGGGYAFSVSIPASSADTDFSRNWINAPGVWPLSTDITYNDNEGEGIVVADVDTGINSGNSSFAATGPKDSYAAVDPTTLRFGVCDSGNTAQHSLKPAFFNCNNKMIGAYTYTHGTNDPNSPEDSEGHGSHTASTIAGNFVDASTGVGSAAISGVAPHASLIVYDVCDPKDLCGSDASVAAVEQAIQDQAKLVSKWGSSFKGMVLNYSIGGGEDPYTDPVEQAFLSAVEVGIYVSASGGNGGPSNAIANDPVNAPQYPVEHRGPWVASTAASTHDGLISNSLESFSGGDATTLAALPTGMTGLSATLGLSTRTIVYAGYSEYQNDDPVIKTGTAKISGQPYPSSISLAENAKQCLYPFMTGTFVGSPIVVCDRGTIPLVDKAYNVQHGGAAGVVIATTSSSSQELVSESYVIPGTLIVAADGDLLRKWLKASTHGTTQAQISAPTYISDTSQADQMTGFSSRGPTNTAFDDLVKPDLTAPGMGVLAAYGNPAYADGTSHVASAPETYAFLDGTSMASPHDTGSAALLMQLHPGWSPAELKSALMLTAITNSLTDQCASLDSSNNCVVSSSIPSPQVRGAGRIDVEAASRAGFVLDETGAHYEAASSTSGSVLTTLNLASLGNEACSATCSWTRTLTSAFTSANVTYNVSVSGITSGLQVTVSPSTFTLNAGGTQTLTISVDSGSVPKDQWAFAEIDFTTLDTGDGGILVAPMHMPVAVRAFTPTPHMKITPGELDFTLKSDASDATSLAIFNDGTASLHWNLSVSDGKSCGSSGMQGLSVSPTSGTVAAGKNGMVSTKFNAGGLAAGKYTGRVCFDSDASDHPQLVIPVVVTVTDASAGGGGGGGSEGLLALAALSLCLVRRKIS